MSYSTTVSLPGVCWAISPVTGGPVKILRGDTVFFGVRIQESIDALNEAAGVSPAQRNAMVGGVLYGWCSAHANPNNYTECGLYTGPKERMVL